MLFSLQKIEDVEPKLEELEMFLEMNGELKSECEFDEQLPFWYMSLREMILLVLK